MAQCIARVNRPTLVMAHNKTLAAQLYQEFRRFFPENAVEYFVSYYDYYQPEAYVPTTDSYIEKEATINDEIDRMRLSATRSLFERRDVIIVASVSCIYGLGSPEAYYGMMLPLERGQRIDREQILRKLVEIQYERNDHEFDRGVFRVRGDIVEVYPSYEDTALRIELFGDEVDELITFDPLTGKTHPPPRQGRDLPEDALRHARAIGPSRRSRASRRSSSWYRGQLEIGRQGARGAPAAPADDVRPRDDQGDRLLPRHRELRAAPDRPRSRASRRRRCSTTCRRDALIIVDESHQTVPQIRGMYHGDRSRKEVLVAYGFRLPSALDNRPLNFEEWEARVGPAAVRVGDAGPVRAARSRAASSSSRSSGRPAWSIRSIEVRPVRGQVDDLLARDPRPGRAQRARAGHDADQADGRGPDAGTTRSSGVKVRYLHSDIETLERIQILRDLRRGEFDVLVGINLLREGLDLPEVSLVAILDADKEGFLRSGGLADPDGRPRGAQRQRPGDHVRRQDDRLDAARDRRDRAAPQHPGGLQRGARHHAGVDRQEHRRGACRASTSATT